MAPGNASASRSNSSLRTHPIQPVALHFGAGNIGRGFIGAVLAQAGSRVIFADVNKQLVDNIKRRGKYTIHILDGHSDDVGYEEKTQPVSDVSAILSNDQDALAEVAVHDLVLITTAVGPAILPKIAPAIVTILRTRKVAGKGPLNIVACENAQHATSMLKDHVFATLRDQQADAALLEYAERNVGWADCAVDRIVPPYRPDDTSLDVGVESFYEWDVDLHSLKKTDPDVDIGGMKPTSNLEKYIQRKLFSLNMGHAITAYLGALKGHKSIASAISDTEIYPIVHGALQESGAALRREHGFTEEEHARYIDIVLARFHNKDVPDVPWRVGREPLRKLKPNDRLVGPTTMCRQMGLNRGHLLRGIAAALAYKNDDDEQAKELQNRIAQDGPEKVVVDILGVDKDDEDVVTVLDAYRELRQQHKL
ncbi:mannitol dehydrogenase C-terminal domain-containing protein [Schizophyllum commune]